MMKYLAFAALGLVLSGCVSESCKGPLRTIPARWNGTASFTNLAGNVPSLRLRH